MQIAVLANTIWKHPVREICHLLAAFSLFMHIPELFEGGQHRVVPDTLALMEELEEFLERHTQLIRPR